MTESIETSPEVFGTRESPQAQAKPVRRPLTSERILHAGLRLIDEQGLEALTMRKLAQEFGVDPMALYRHFENKDALLDSVAEMLWGEVELPGSEAGWEVLLRSHFPASLAPRQFHLSPQHLRDAVQQRVFVLEVAIQSHRIHPKLLGELAHGERLQPLLINQPQAGVQDALAGEWPAHGFSLRLW